MIQSLSQLPLLLNTQSHVKKTKNIKHTQVALNLKTRPPPMPGRKKPLATYIKSCDLFATTVANAPAVA